MKYLLLTSLILFSLQAKELTPSQVVSTYNYNHKTSTKIKQKKVLQKLAVIKKDEATKLAYASCNSKIEFSKLLRHNKRLFYAIKTNNCSIKIDALDGSIISKKVIQ